MKKLKTWQIVLLVIFYPVGIFVLIYRLWKKNELKKEAAEAARLQAEEKARKEAEREEARRREEAYRATLNREIFRVVGVTFKNPGGRSRQTILREIKREEPSTYSFSLRKYDFEGKPAVGVFYGEEQVGSISTGDLKRALSQIDRFKRVESYDVTGGFVYEDIGPRPAPCRRLVESLCKCPHTLSLHMCKENAPHGLNSLVYYELSPCRAHGGEGCVPPLFTGT